MHGLLDKIRHDLHPSQVRRGLTNRRRIIASVLAGLGALLLVASIRPSPTTPQLNAPVSVAVQSDEVAVPITVRPATIASALTPGMVIDVVPADPSAGNASVVRSARVLRLPASGFGPTSEAVVVVAVSPADGMELASADSAGFGVIIRPTPT